MNPSFCSWSTARALVPSLRHVQYVTMSVSRGNALGPRLDLRVRHQRRPGDGIVAEMIAGIEDDRLFPAVATALHVFGGDTPGRRGVERGRRVGGDEHPRKRAREGEREDESSISRQHAASVRPRAGVVNGPALANGCSRPDRTPHVDTSHRLRYRCRSTSCSLAPLLRCSSHSRRSSLPPCPCASGPSRRRYRPSSCRAPATSRRSSPSASA